MAENNERKLQMTEEELIYTLKTRINELEDEFYDLQEKYDNVKLKDTDNFVRQCKIRNLWTKELDDFLEEYLRFFND